MKQNIPNQPEPESPPGSRSNFWREFTGPIFALAPMEDVTDTVFREIVLGVSDPACLHVLFAEFTSTDGLCHPEGKKDAVVRLLVNPSERELLRKMGVKLVAQIWGAQPENFHTAARMICQEMDFDGLDINMGCPVKKIVRQGGCSALIDQPDLATEIVLATREAADIPVSVKTRTGLREAVTESWIETLLRAGPDAITLHGRTQKSMTRVPADWDEIAKAVRLRDAGGYPTRILGNGDVVSFGQGMQYVKRYGVDGIMVGRGIFQDPWLFNRSPREGGSFRTPTRREKLDLLWSHTELYFNTWHGRKNFVNLRKFYKIYVSGFPGASQLRQHLMTVQTPGEVRQLLDSHLRIDS